MSWPRTCTLYACIGTGTGTGTTGPHASSSTRAHDEAGLETRHPNASFGTHPHRSIELFLGAGLDSYILRVACSSHRIITAAGIIVERLGARTRLSMDSVVALAR